MQLDSRSHWLFFKLIEDSFYRYGKQRVWVGYLSPQDSEYDREFFIRFRGRSRTIIEFDAKPEVIQEILKEGKDGQRLRIFVQKQLLKLKSLKLND